MDIYHLDSFDQNCWSNLIDYSCLLDDHAPPIEYVAPNPLSQIVGMSMDVSISEITSQVNAYEEIGFPRKSVGMSMDVSVSEITSNVNSSEEIEIPRKRGRTDACGRTGTKACRERMRREKLNERFAELSAVLEPGKPVKTDKFAILSDAIRHINHLKIESQEYIEANRRLMEEIKNLKDEKNELREEKAKLKADKERMEQQVKSMNIAPADVNKVGMFPSYGFVPMWQYLPQSVRDTSQDHDLRPPAA